MTAADDSGTARRPRGGRARPRPDDDASWADVVGAPAWGQGSSAGQGGHVLAEQETQILPSRRSRRRDAAEPVAAVTPVQAADPSSQPMGDLFSASLARMPAVGARPGESGAEGPPSGRQWWSAGSTAATTAVEATTTIPVATTHVSWFGSGAADPPPGAPDPVSSGALLDVADLTGVASRVAPLPLPPALDAAEPMRPEPTPAGPTRAEAVRVKPMRVDPMRVEPMRVEPMRIEPMHVEPMHVQPMHAELVVEPVPMGSSGVDPFQEPRPDVVAAAGRVTLPPPGVVRSGDGERTVIDLRALESAPPASPRGQGGTGRIARPSGAGTAGPGPADPGLAGAARTAQGKRLPGVAARPPVVPAGPTLRAPGTGPLGVPVGQRGPLASGVWSEPVRRGVADDVPDLLRPPAPRATAGIGDDAAGRDDVSPPGTDGVETAGLVDLTSDRDLSSFPVAAQGAAAGTGGGDEPPARRPRSGRSRRDATPSEPPKAGRNLPVAIGVGLLLAGAVVASLAVRKEAFVGLVSAAVVVAVWELSTAFAAKQIAIPIPPLAVGAVGMLVSAFVAGPPGLMVAFALTAFGVLLYRIIEGFDGAVRDVTAGVFTAAYVPFLAGFSMLMLAEDDGPMRVVVFILVTVCNDVGGYAAGVLLGRHPMAPSGEPEEVLGGLRRLGRPVHRRRRRRRRALARRAVVGRPRRRRGHRCHRDPR